MTNDLVRNSPLTKILLRLVSLYVMSQSPKLSLSVPPDAFDTGSSDGEPFSPLPPEIQRLRNDSDPKSEFRRKKSRIVRQNPIPKVPVGFFSIIRTMTVDFVLPNEKTVTLNCVGNQTVGQIKSDLLERIRDQYLAYEKVWEHELLLTYTIDGKTYEICDMHQTFQTLRVINMWTKTGLKGTLDVRHLTAESNEERLFNLTLGSLMGVIWGKYGSMVKHNTAVTDDEVYVTRRKLTNVRRRALRSRFPSTYSMEPILDHTTPPTHVKANFQEDETITVCIYGPSKSSTTMSVGVYDPPSKIMEDFFESLTPARKIAFGIPEEAKAPDYVLKVCGMCDYIWGPHEIMDFVYIRHCVARRREPQLALCVPPNDAEDEVLSVHDPWFFVDDSTGVTENHQQLTLVGCKKNHTEIVAFSLWDMTRKFRIKVLGVDYLTPENETVGTPDELYVEFSLYSGRQRLAEPVRTKPVASNADLRWYTSLEFDILLRNVPKEARLNANIIGIFRTKSVKVKTGIKSVSSNGDQHVILRWANMQLLNHRSVLCTGRHAFKTWPMSYSEDVSVETHTGTTAPNDGVESTSSTAEIHFELDSYMHPVVFPNGGWKTSNPEDQAPDPIHGSSDWKKLEEIIQSDTLTELTLEDKALLKKYRSYCRGRANSLPKVLQAVDAASLDSVVDMHALLNKWPALSVEVALELLDSQYEDEKVRSLAVKTLKCLSNTKLHAYLLQLTQVLKFEPYHDSALARFLLTRALQSKRIGHYFFWFLRSEIENPHVSQRYSILLEAYLRGCGSNMLKEFSKQCAVTNTLKNFSSLISMKLSKNSNSGLKTEILREQLARISLPETFKAPFDPRITLGRLMAEKSKIMDSKKKPLWLEFENADENVINESTSVIRIIFKQGDDLRQDMLTLQMLSLMGQLWNEEGLDLHLLPYGCLSTGLQVGIIQIVPNATTVARIQKESGGLIRGTFKDEVLKKWLERKNPTTDRMNSAVETFMLSCAGYCVATYVLGIGDRHNDNIMVTESGNLFHIDFGHFLGNTKRFYGIQRERVPFVLTPDFVHVMGTEDGELFQRFMDTCVLAYLVIRRHAPLFINLFHMMKSTGIPELNSVRDIRYLQNVLVLDKTEHEASQHFLSEIAGVLRKNWTVQVNWLMHRLVHSGSS
uniref:phosphatidylinositol 4,5-bisphosphate 3-kinase catalytic subunit gamma isoform isoform X1 n=2 Tax=Ciona intestinalis TaxID=7719 RepID=UPI00089DB99A|nr:phosphatidylinositol 4,5-bisphosphate 3-kinase catalytic subunit gamma isoform isoform X1 [Ciona intestinalis]XP_026691477.1 phosphatidylinositol 4,5-bisphosphate 3-kinase catalytic subunit gamma isoform isoform X1 [Ciona intestinalis]|eukprot:XP_018668461.1 phosphatidylinositol 4,5-bisphosphate 3-kinase catalytic subunit gamma isoform isoform X1 [Ciona intestinalis]